MHAQDVPKNITTPDLVQTKTLGELNFKDGYPSDETMSKVQKYMYVQRAVNVLKRFWSFMVYDNQTRSILSTDQKSGGFDSTGEVVTNPDGSVTVTFSSKKPKGKSNWVQTLPNKGFFVMYRMYSPTKDWHDRKYMIGDLIKK